MCGFMRWPDNRGPMVKRAYHLGPQLRDGHTRNTWEYIGGGGVQAVEGEVGGYIRSYMYM